MLLAGLVLPFLWTPVGFLFVGFLAVRYVTWTIHYFGSSFIRNMEPEQPLAKKARPDILLEQAMDDPLLGKTYVITSFSTNFLSASIVFSPLFCD